MLAGGRLEVMRWQCRFMQAWSTLTDFKQRQRIHVAIALEVTRAMTGIVLRCWQST